MIPESDWGLLREDETYFWGFYFFVAIDKMPKPENPVNANDLVDYGDTVRRLIRGQPQDLTEELQQQEEPAGSGLRDYGPEFAKKLREEKDGTQRARDAAWASSSSAAREQGEPGTSSAANSSDSRSMTPPARRPRGEGQKSPEQASPQAQDDAAVEEGESAAKQRRRLTTKTRPVPEFPVPSNPVNLSGPVDAQDRGRPLNEGRMNEYYLEIDG